MKAPKQTAASLLSNLATGAEQQATRLNAFAGTLRTLDPEKATLFDLAQIADRHGFRVEPLLLQRPEPTPKKKTKRGTR